MTRGTTSPDGTRITPGDVSGPQPGLIGGVHATRGGARRRSAADAC